MRLHVISVLAPSRAAAESFVAGTLKDDLRRLYYISGPDALRGRAQLIVYILEGAHERKDFQRIMDLIAQRGDVVLHVDTVYSRRKIACEMHGYGSKP